MGQWIRTSHLCPLYDFQISSTVPGFVLTRPERRARGMCGRFANSETIPAQAARWGANLAEPAPAWEPDSDLRPTMEVPVLLEGGGRPRRLGLMTWGWQRSFARGGLIINARMEGIQGRAAFATALRQRRCLVPATAWFEWQLLGEGRGQRRKHLLRPAGLETWALAGIWERTASGAAVVLATTAAHASVAGVHGRMPVIIGLDRAGIWLAGELEEALALGRGVEALALPC